MKTKHPSLATLALSFGLVFSPQFGHSEPSPEQASSNQPPSKETEETVADIIGKEIPVKKTNDPFANTTEMLKRVTESNPLTSTLSALTGSLDMQLRGSVIDDDGNALALLEISDGKVHVVRVGDTLSLRTHGKNSSVKIMAIHRQSVELEFGDFDEYVVVR